MTKEEKEQLEVMAAALGLEGAAATIDNVVGNVVDLVALVETSADVKPIADAIEAHRDEGDEELPQTPEGVVLLAVAIVEQTATMVARVEYLEGALAEAGDDLAAMGPDIVAAPAFLVWCDNGKISRGHVRRGTAASLARGDYTGDDLALVAHKTITERQFGGYARKFGQVMGAAPLASAANSPAEAADRAHRKARSKGTGPRGGQAARFGELRSSAAPARAQASTSREAMPERPQREQNKGLWGDPKASRNN